MRLRTSCDLAFDILDPASFILMLRPRSGMQQWIEREEYILRPQVPVREFTDHYGNFCQRLVAPVGPFSIHTSALVYITDRMMRVPGAPFMSIQDLPDDVLIYLLPSRYCEAEHFGQLATEITAGQKPGYNQVSAIETWLRSSLRYDSRLSDLFVSAVEVNARQSGVCRDFAHLGIALCRSISIPARMVVGYLHDLLPMDLHAWFEAFVGGRWYTFDATQPYLRVGYVTLGRGRDAADVAVYNQFGAPVFPVQQRVTVESIEVLNIT
ncbi:MAG: transglutaminase family protein [Proteobacteria bacterium]|nr:transglutaminase family protein [Pseudomonadota bacterium]